MTRKDLEILADLVAEKLASRFGLRTLSHCSEKAFALLPVRFSDKIDLSDGCWHWTAHRNAKGYGVFSIKTKPVLAHRFSYELLRGEIPDGLQLDHLCRIRHCVNPWHLEAVTAAENFRRGERWPD